MLSFDFLMRISFYFFENLSIFLDTVGTGQTPKNYLKKFKFYFFMFEIYLFPGLEKTLKKLLSKQELLELKILLNGDLKTKGDKIGKQLSYPFLREKKLGNKRIYYLVYEDVVIILLVAASDKKHQQETIDNIKLDLVQFKEYAYSLKRFK